MRQDQKTSVERVGDLMPIISFLVSLIGGAIWITAYGAKIAEKVDTIEAKQNDYNHNVQSIDRRLAHIEGKLEGKSK